MLQDSMLFVFLFFLHMDVNVKISVTLLEALLFFTTRKVADISNAFEGTFCLTQLFIFMEA